MQSLLIGTFFKRPKSPVELPNGDGTFTQYFFTPIDPKNPESEHVASVTNPKHVQRLLAIPEGYYISEAQGVVEAAAAAAQSVAKPARVETVRAPAPTPAPPDEPVQAAAPEQVAPPDPAPPPEAPAATASHAIAATALLALPLRALKAAVADSAANHDVLREALRIETAKGEDERATVTKALKAALKV